MKWIDIKYSRPDEGNEVIISVEQDEGPDGKSEYVRTGVRLGNVFYTGVEKSDQPVLHVKGWMPLPEPFIEHEQANSCLAFKKCRYAGLPDCNDDCRFRPY